MVDSVTRRRLLARAMLPSRGAPEVSQVVAYHARPLAAHVARLRVGLRCALKTKKRVPRAPRANARLANPQIAAAWGTLEPFHAMSFALKSIDG
jgi:hypothetical protein